jgi:hypothetical protein
MVTITKTDSGRRSHVDDHSTRFVALRREKVWVVSGRM